MQRQLLGSFGPVSTYLLTDDDGANERFQILSRRGGAKAAEIFENAGAARNWIERGHKVSTCLPNTPDELRGLLEHVRMWIRDCAARAFGAAGVTLPPGPGKVTGTPLAGQDSAGVKAAKRMQEVPLGTGHGYPAMALVPSESALEMAERVTGPRVAVEAAWLLWDSSISKWWKPGGFGYTENVMHAGVFTLEAAEHAVREGVDSVFHITWALAPGSAEEGSVHALLTSGGMAALNEATVPADDLGEVGR